MAIYSKLYYSHRWENREITDIVSRLLKSKMKLDGSAFVDGEALSLQNNNTYLTIHMSVDTPIGNCRLLSMPGQNQSLLRQIGECIGGFYSGDDGATWECLQGKLWEENGLQFFLKSAAIHNENFDGESIGELQTTIQEWEKKHGTKSGVI